MVFLGVSLSFVAENARENRKERTDEGASLERALQDLEASDFGIEWTRAGTSLEASRRIMLLRDSTPPTPEELSTLLTAAVQCTRVVVVRAEYESLRSSGGLDLLRNADLRQLLAAHYERYETVLDLGALDCTVPFTRPIASEVRVENMGGNPTYVVTGSVRLILTNPDFGLELGHAIMVKSYLNTRYRIMDEQRTELMNTIRDALVQ